jgi:hypothetical protein
MKTLIKVSMVLAGMLAAATSLADQRAMVVDSSAEFLTLRAIPAGLFQLSDDQLREIRASGLLSSPFGLRAIDATVGARTPQDQNKIKFMEGSRFKTGNIPSGIVIR